MTRLLSALEAGRDGGQVGLELVRALERVEHRLVVSAAVPDPGDAPALDLSRDEPTERVSDALGPGEDAEVVPDVVGGLDARLAIADRRRPLLAGIGAGSSSASSSHGTSVERASLDPSAYSRMRRITGAIVCLSWRFAEPRARDVVSASWERGSWPSARHRRHDDDERS
jgi:hypothetical protein